MHLPKSWSEIDVFQFKEIRSLSTIEETFTREIEILATLADIPSDDLEDLDISEVGAMLKDITFVNSEPSKLYKHVLDDWKFKPLSKLTVGEFIDLEYFFSNDYIKHISHVASILYRKHSINEWGDLVYEPYKYSPFDRHELFDEYCINQIFGIIPEYLAYRTTFMERYKLLFEEDEPDDEPEVRPTNSEDAKAVQQHKSAIKWSWERLLYGLCNEDLTKFDQVTDMPLVLTFNMMSMKKELNI